MWVACAGVPFFQFLRRHISNALEDNDTGAEGDIDHYILASHVQVGPPTNSGTAIYSKGTAPKPAKTFGCTSSQTCNNGGSAELRQLLVIR